MFDSSCIVKVKSGQKNGSGVEIGHGLVLTCAHVIERWVSKRTCRRSDLIFTFRRHLLGCRGEPCSVMQAGKVTKGTVCYHHQELDVAVIMLHGHHRAFTPILAQALHPVALSPAAQPPALIYGFPQRSDLSRSTITTTSGTVHAVTAKKGSSSGSVLLKATCPGELGYHEGS